MLKHYKEISKTFFLVEVQLYDVFRIKICNVVEDEASSLLKIIKNEVDRFNYLALDMVNDDVIS